LTGCRHFTVHQIQNILDLFAQGFNAIFTAKTPELRIIKKDPDDDKFLECAVALKAQIIISGDKYVTDIKEYMGIKIYSPAGFLREHT